jgi:hypothetical protein
MTSDEAGQDEPVDVAALMREIRRRAEARERLPGDEGLAQALAAANRQWDKIYEPLRLPPARSSLGPLWSKLRASLHQEVRSYLDPMIYRQIELNASVVRALNSLAQPAQGAASAAELEALRDELSRLRERVRQLEEKLGE